MPEVSPETQEQHPVERPEMLDFLPYLKRAKEFSSHHPSIRVTPKGLFVEQSVVDAVAEVYRAWFSDFTNHAAHRTLEKSKIKLFGEQPESQYLVEGKNVLLGFLAPAAIPNAQSYGLPYYLGSVLGSKDYLHPKDPVLASLNLTMRTTPQGTEVTAAIRNRSLKIPRPVLDSFLRIARFSPYLQKRFAGIENSSAIALKALITIVERSRIMNKDAAVLVPHRYRDAKGAFVRLMRKFLIVEQSAELKMIAELNGRNFVEFLRSELATGPKQALGSFRLGARRDPNLGTFNIRGTIYTLRPWAFAEFVETIARARDPRDKFQKPFTAQDCFEKFSSFFQLAQPMDRSKIEKPLADRGIAMHSARVHGGWVFAISRKGVITRVVARHIRVPRRKGPEREED